MTKNANGPIAVLLCAVMLLVQARASAQTPQAAAAGGLRIVVISGEDAVNIIQQKTAVNPIVEVRDRNDLPVSGVAVTFNLGGGGGASFAGGASTLTVTTNAAGQAVVTGLTPTTAGAVSINATAVVNGQTIAATITQTNFATAAEAASAASSAGGASGSGGGASGGGTSGAAGGGGGGIGGMSGTTLGIVGGGIAAAGALVATQAGGGDSSPAASTGATGNTGTGAAGTPTTPAPTTPAPAAPTTQTFTGPFSGIVTFMWTTSADNTVIQSCTATYTRAGTLRIVLETRSDGSAGGTGQIVGVSTRINSGTCTDGTFIPLNGIVDDAPADGALVPITGTAASLRYSENFSQTDSADGVTVNITGTSSFAGSLSGGVITGTLTESFQMTGGGSGVTIRGNWSSTIPVTLR